MLGVCPEQDKQGSPLREGKSHSFNHYSHTQRHTHTHTHTETHKHNNRTTTTEHTHTDTHTYTLTDTHTHTHTEKSQLGPVHAQAAYQFQVCYITQKKKEKHKDTVTLKKVKHNIHKCTLKA